MDPLHSLLTGIVDYAGLFPPTGASMEDAAAEFRRQRATENRWMLGAFVVPAARLEELAATPSAGSADRWPLSVLVGGADQLPELSEFLGRHPGRFDLAALEWKPQSPGEIESFLHVAPQVEVFCELPWQEDPAPWVAQLARTGARAKLRCGGVTSDLIPPVHRVAAILRACIGAGVGLKFTAGLHHPVRSEHPLTYEPDAPRATMHGFLNVFVATALLATGELADTDLESVLSESVASAFSVTAESVRWRDRQVPAPGVARTRAQLARSFGSCSFAEPVQDLHTLGML